MVFKAFAYRALLFVSIALTGLTAKAHATDAEPAALASRLTVQFSAEHPTDAVVFVGGIHETYRYFDSWGPQVAGENTLVVGFDHDAATGSMSAAALELEQGIEALGDEGVTRITVIAHSMGGLIAKAALDELVRRGQASRFTTVDLHTFGTPFGGFMAAEPAHLMPFGKVISDAIGLPMGPEIGPTSAFMRHLSQPWPANMALHLYIGTEDAIAQPKAYFTKRRYEAVTTGAQTMEILDGYGHTDYVKAGPGVLKDTRQPSVAMD